MKTWVGTESKNFLFQKYFSFLQDFKSLRSHLDLDSLHILFWFLLLMKMLGGKKASFTENKGNFEISVIKMTWNNKNIC